MKKLLVAFFAIIALLASTPLSAEEVWKPFEQKDAPPKVPTGYQVKGCKDYYIAKKDGKVYNVCKKQVGERWWWYDVQSNTG